MPVVNGFEAPRARGIAVGESGQPRMVPGGREGGGGLSVSVGSEDTVVRSIDFYLSGQRALIVSIINVEVNIDGRGETILKFGDVGSAGIDLTGRAEVR